MQYFKGDDDEIKVDAVLGSIAEAVNDQRSLFFEDAYNAFPLGDVLYSSARSPLANAILQSIYRASFNEVFTAFQSAGSFESYLSVFKRIFGDDVVVTFTVPAAGKLDIDIEATGVELSPFVERLIEDNAYVFSPVITQGLENIVFQTVKGFQSQYELELMLNEMVPVGVFTNISLTLG